MNTISHSGLDIEAAQGVANGEPWGRGLDWSGDYLGQTSPTKEDETLGQSIQRVATDIYLEASTPGVTRPNRHLDAEAVTLLKYTSETGDNLALDRFSAATQEGFQLRSTVVEAAICDENPPEQIKEMVLAELLGTGAPAEDPADLNPAFAHKVAQRTGTSGDVNAEVVDEDDDEGDEGDDDE